MFVLPADVLAPHPTLGPSSALLGWHETAA
jgi:hypothetical protein